MAWLKRSQSKQNRGDRTGEVSSLVDGILRAAVAERSSDVHIDPGDCGALVRFRVDGVFHKKNDIPKDLVPKVVSRIKLLARLVTYRQDMAQEGRIGFGEGIDLRVSVIPTISGEKITLRILDAKQRFESLSDLGLDATASNRLKDRLMAHQGLLLTCGPSGSGKTTTLYTCAEEIRNRRGNFVNIMSVEDPAERRISGVHQVQVDRDRQLDFPGTLKFLLRQDPEVILVGEIRDVETARTAVEAGLTGHLVLSSIHAGSTAEAYLRIIDLGVHPRMAGAAIRGLIAQRLVRRVCSNCSESLSSDRIRAMQGRIRAIHERLGLTGDTLRHDLSPLSAVARRGKGCTECRATGYRGRLLLASLQTGPFPAVSGSGLSRDALGDMDKQCRQDLLKGGLEYLRRGYTTIDELFRVLAQGVSESVIQKRMESGEEVSCVS
ncbi:GspE/PulE family protein [Acidobacteriota bacterium]